MIVTNNNNKLKAGGEEEKYQDAAPSTMFEGEGKGGDEMDKPIRAKGIEQGERP